MAECGLCPWRGLVLAAVPWTIFGPCTAPAWISQPAQKENPDAGNCLGRASHYARWLGTRRAGTVRGKRAIDASGLGTNRKSAANCHHYSRRLGRCRPSASPLKRTSDGAKSRAVCLSFEVTRASGPVRALHDADGIFTPVKQSLDVLHGRFEWNAEQLQGSRHRADGLLGSARLTRRLLLH